MELSEKDYYQYLEIHPNLLRYIGVKVYNGCNLKMDEETIMQLLQKSGFKLIQRKIVGAVMCLKYKKTKMGNK